MKPGFPVNMPPLGPDQALPELLTFTVDMNEDRFGLWQCQSQCTELMWHCCRWAPCTTFSPTRDTALRSCWDSRIAGTGPGHNPVQVPAAKAKARQGDNGSCDTASVAQSFLYSLALYQIQKRHICGCLYWLIQSTISLHFAMSENWTAADDCGHSPWSDHLCHPFDNSLVIPKHLRVTHVVPGFDKLNYSLASSVDCICSKFLLKRLSSHCWEMSLSFG